MFSKDKVKDIYRSCTGFNEELNKKYLPTGDKELAKFATKIRKKSNILERRDKSNEA
jgi:hypothetical protein